MDMFVKELYLDCERAWRREGGERNVDVADRETNLQSEERMWDVELAVVGRLFSFGGECVSERTGKNRQRRK